jgi:CheY-like chemotaxis protein
MATESSLLALPERAAPIRVLIVEDNTSDAMVAQAAVEHAAFGPTEVRRAGSLVTALAAVASTEPHLVLLDLNMADSRGLGTLERMRAAVRCPVIVITAEDQPGLDQEALEKGAFEILHKGKLTPDAIARVLRLAEGQRKVQASLESAEQRYRQLIEVAPDAIFVHADWRIALVNPAMVRLFRAERPSSCSAQCRADRAQSRAVPRRIRTCTRPSRRCRWLNQYQRLDGSLFGAR